MKRIITIVAAVLAAGAPQAFAQGYPNKPVHVIISFTPGSATDIVGRVVTSKLVEYWGQPVVADNRAGAAGILAAETGIARPLTALTAAGLFHPGSIVRAKARIRADIVWQQIVRGKFQSSFQFREKDILAAIENKKDDKGDDVAAKTVAYDYVLRPILFILPKGAPQSAVAARQREAEAMRSRIEDCEQGLRFARALPDVLVLDPVTRNSADLPPALQEILERTGVGRLTNPETTDRGIQVFAVCDKRETKVDTPAMRKTRSEMFSKQFEAKSKRYLSELRRQALIEMK